MCSRVAVSTCGLMLSVSWHANNLLAHYDACEVGNQTAESQMAYRLKCLYFISNSVWFLLTGAGSSHTQSGAMVTSP